MTATETAQKFAEGDTVRVTASYGGVTIGAQGAVRRAEPDHGLILIDLPVRGRMQYPADSLELVRSAIVPQEKTQVEHLVSRHVDRLRKMQGEPAEATPHEGVTVTRSTTADDLIAAANRAPATSLDQALAAERDLQNMTPEEFDQYRRDPNGIGHDPTSMAERRVDDTERARVVDAGRAAVSENKAPESDETTEKISESLAPPQRRMAAAERGAAISHGKALAREERRAVAETTEPALTKQGTTEVSRHLRFALAALLAEVADATDLVVVARMIEDLEA